MGCSKYKGLNKNHQCITLYHYINDRIPKVDGMIPPTVLNNQIGDIEKKHWNTSICSFFESLQAISTTFPPKLANPSPYVESMERYYRRQSMISILPKISLLGYQKHCMS
jgi:hypothetical protein